LLAHGRWFSTGQRRRLNYRRTKKPQTAIERDRVVAVESARERVVEIESDKERDIETESERERQLPPCLFQWLFGVSLSFCSLTSFSDPWEKPENNKFD
jgi:hypothetical protein